MNNHSYILIRALINKTFGLRDGEIRISFLMQLYIFLIITVLLIVKPTVNALFLSKLGAEHLPLGYILVAVIATCITYFYNRAVVRFSLNKVITTTLIFFSLGFISLYLIMNSGNLGEYYLYIYYVGVALFAVIATSQFWMLANLVFNAREAKRLFGFIGAGAIAGGIFGGYLTSIIVSRYSNGDAILLASFFILCCIPVIQQIWHWRVKKLNEFTKKQRIQVETSSHESAFKIVLKSKHLSYLALITGLGVIVAKIVDFQFSDLAHKSITDPDKLASFFGFWFSTFNVIALGTQLFLTNKLLSRLGVSSSLLILPLGIALGSLLLIAIPELWVLILIKGIDGSFKQSLNKAATELSIMPIPFQIKNQAKSFIDVAVDSMATGFAGLMLFIMVRKLKLESFHLTLLVVFFSLLWIILIYKLRETYFNSFRINIQRNLNYDHHEEKKHNKASTLAYARKVFISATPKEIIDLLGRLSPYKISALRPEIIQLLKHPSNKIKKAVIRQLHHFKSDVSKEKIEALLKEPDPEVIYYALEYLLDFSYKSKTAFFDQFLNHHDPRIARAALLCLAKETSQNKKLAKKYHLESRISDWVQELSAPDGFSNKVEVAELLETIAYSGIQKYYPFINVHLYNKSKYIVKRAIKAAAITLEKDYIPLLTPFLKEKAFRNQAIKALKTYGPDISTRLLHIDDEINLDDEIKRFIPKIIGAFETQNSVQMLSRLLKNEDVYIRLEASKALVKLKSKNENLIFNRRSFKKSIIRECEFAKETLDVLSSIIYVLKSQAIQHQEDDDQFEIKIAQESLKDLLEKQLDQSFLCIFKLLSLLYEEADMNVSYSGILSETKEARINALEFLDNLLQSQLSNRILPLVEYYIVEEQDLKHVPLKINIVPEKAYLKLLLKKRDNRVKLEVLHLIKVLNLSTLSSEVSDMQKHTNRAIRIYATETMKQFANSA